MLKPLYFIRLNGESLNISDLVDTRETLITRQLCTTKFKSAVDTASITIKYSPDRASLRTQILDMLYSSLETLEDVELNIRLDSYSLFKGYLDLTELKLVSKRLPEVLKLEAQDVSAKILDRKVNDYIFFENKTVSEIVESLIYKAGGTFSNNAMLPQDDRVVPVFTVDREDDDDTYREYIDKLLFEAGGYVLDTNEYGTMSIVALPWENYNPTKTVDDFQLEKGIETSRKLFDKDGLKVVWSTLAETDKNQRVWTAEFSRQIKDGKVTGITVPAGGYYPENGDIEATYQPFSVDFLDREYITKQKREQNKDLSIIAVRDVSAQMVSLGSDGKPFPNEYTWEFPILPSLGMVTNPTIYGKKAWYLLRNRQSSPMNLQMFTLEGRVLYRSKINYLTIPATAEKLEEYKSEYIFTEEHAKRFAQFYWHFVKYTSTIHKWSVLGDVALGDVVKILHKGASAAQATMIVSETLHFVGNTSKIDCVGVALGAYNEYPVKSWTDSESVTPPVQLPEAPKSLAIDVYPSNIPYYADNFPVDETTKIKVTVRGENTTEAINVAWVGGKTTLPKEGGIIEIPVKDLTAVDVLPVSATTSGITASATVSKSFKAGKLNLFANKHMFGFYADNVAHDPNETIHIDYMATGFKNEPTVYIDGVSVTMDVNKAYDIPVSAMQNKDSLKIEAKIAGFYDSMTIQKVMDVPSLNLVLSGTQFFYSADNVAHDLAAKIHVAVKTSGIYQKPVLKIDGVAEPLDVEQSCVIPTSKCDNELNLHLEATCFTLTRTADINKVMDIPSVSLSLSTDHFTYYADNVVREGQPDIVASTNSMGIARGLKLTVNGNEFPLNDAGQVFIPSAVLDGNIESVDVKVEPRYVVTISDVRKISKEYMTPSLTLLTDAAQFAFDINGMPSPEVANIEWRTEGLSSAIVPSLKVQNQPRQWVGNKTSISYLEIVSANFLRVIAEVERFNLKREIVINKVNDSKAILPIIEYAYGSSPTEPPAAAWLAYRDHALTYGEMQLIYKEGWQSMRPELVPADKPYLWMRISVDNGKTFTYSPLTGPKGEDGKQSVYCGMNTSRPLARPDGTPLVVGDYYLNISDKSQPVPYILDENGVWRIVTTTDPNWSAIASVTREDVLGLGVALNTSSAYYGFFAMLSANEAYLDNLGAQNIVMKNGGVIQTQNYIDSDGIEGWKIDSDGSADFNNGTWRGSFANGLVFNAPTHVEIDKNMSQREAYKLMKKAGIVSGIYNARSTVMSKFQNSTINLKKPGVPLRCVDYASFSCLDYDTDKVACNIPIILSKKLIRFNYHGSDGVVTPVYAYETPFGPCAMIFPFSFNAYILTILKPLDVNPDQPLPYTDYDIDGYYVLTKTALERLMNQRADADPVMTDIIKKYIQHQSTPAYDYYEAMRNYFGVYKLRALDKAFASLTDQMHFYIYPVVTDTRCTVFIDHVNSALDPDAAQGTILAVSTLLDSEPKSEQECDLLALDFPGINEPYITGYLTMLTSIQTEGDTITVCETGRDETGNLIRKFYKTDFNTDIEIVPGGMKGLHFHELQSLPSVGNFIRDVYEAVLFDGRIFVLQSDVQAEGITFGEIVGTEFRPIPNETMVWKIKDEYSGKMLPNFSIANLFLNDGIIYGSVCGSVWRYDILSDKFYDMSPDVAELFHIELTAGEGLPTQSMLNTRRTAMIGMTASVANQVKSYNDIYFTTDGMVNNICWDKKEQSILYNLKVKFNIRNDVDAKEDEVADNDSFICVPVFYNPVTQRYKLFAMATNLFRKTSLPYGRFTSISDANRRVFASDSCVLFMNGISLRNDVFVQKNWSVDEWMQNVAPLDGSVAMGISMVPPELLTVYQDYIGMGLPYLYSLAFFGVFELTMRYYENGRKSKGMLVPADVLKIGAVFPFFSRRIIIREDANGLRLLVPMIVTSFATESTNSLEMTEGSMFATSEIFSNINDWDGYIVGDSMEPFLTIDKNSDEAVGASFIWNFPAQFTTIEGLGQVIDMITNAWDLIDNNYLKVGDIKGIEAIARKIYEDMNNRK